MTVQDKILQYDPIVYRMGNDRANLGNLGGNWTLYNSGSGDYYTLPVATRTALQDGFTVHTQYASTVSASVFHFSSDLGLSFMGAYIYSGERVSYGFGDTGIIYGLPSIDGEVHSVTTVFDGVDTFRHYFDGVLVATATGQQPTFPQYFQRGSRSSNISYHHVALFESALSDQQVQEIHTGTDFVAGDLEVPVGLADANGEMLDAQFSDAVHVSVSALAATASAITNDAAVTTTRDPNIKRVLSPSIVRGGYNEISRGTLGTSAGYSGADLRISIPTGEAQKIYPDDTIEGRDFVIKWTLIQNESVTYKVLGALNEELSSGSFILSQGTNRVSLPAEAETILIPKQGNSSFDNPGNDTSDSTGSYFDVTIPSNRNLVRPAPFTGSATMANANGSVLNSVSIGAVTATASAEMPGGYRPDAQFAVAVMDVSASMGRGYFRSDRRVYVGAAEAGGFMHESTDHRVEKEMTISVTAPARASARSIEPATINGKEIDPNVNDPYYNRVTRRSNAGPLPPAVSQWFRLNQREGDLVERLSSAGTKVDSTDRIVGDYSWGAAGPNGKRGLAARDARFGNFSPTTFGSVTSGTSLEFTVKVEPGHTGRMDVAWGQARDSMGGLTTVNWRTSIVDGRIYSTTAYGGTSIKRIDDGEWHHIVITTTEDSAYDYTYSGYTNQKQHNLAIFIDGELDRMLTSEENRRGTGGGALAAARPTGFLGGGTEYPFKGEILDIVVRQRPVVSHEVKELYLDMFGYKPVRAGVTDTAVGEAFQGHRVQSTMKRMLIVSWRLPTRANGLAWSAHNDNGTYQFSVTPGGGKLGPALGYGWDDELDIGRYLVTYQMATSRRVQVPAQSYEDRMWGSGWMLNGEGLKESAQPENAGGNQFIDPVTGRRRLLDLVEDIDLDQFDVIAFQAYPNPQYRDMHERQMYEAFLESIRKALVMGKKMWINDPYLAADLGLISDVEEVPVLGRVLGGRIYGHDRYGMVGGPDVRGYEVAPFIGLEGGKFPKPADGSLPVIHRAIPEGSQHGLADIWGGDIHHNNGYRVVNEIEGLTDIPSWELEEMYWRDRTEMLPQDDRSYQGFGYRLENRTGEDFEWGPADGFVNFPLKKESKGTGLKVGDEFYNYLTFIRITRTFWRTEQWLEMSDARIGRTYKTWAVPPGHLRVGTPVTTFRSTLWNDYGDEIANPYRDYIRNFVIRPGDRLPDGRKVNGYAYVDIAEHPSFGSMAGMSINKQLTDGPGTGGTTTYKPENEYTFEWDWSDYNRRTFTSRGNVTSVQVKFYYGPRMSGGAVSQASKGEKIEWALPLAPTVSQRYATIALAHQTWNTRGMSWLTMVDVEDAEVALGYQEGSMAASAEMLSPMVDVEFDNVISVGAAQASARIVDPGETVIKSTVVTAYAATARGTMMGLQGGYKAEAATSFGDMPQNVRRPLDKEEVLFFTVSFTLEPIYVRMEEN